MSPAVGIGIGLPFIISGGGGVGGGPPPGGPFPVNAVNFDGTNDYLTRGGGLTGAVDGAALLLSLWFNILGADDLQPTWVDTLVNRVYLIRNVNNQLQFQLQSPIGTELWRMRSTPLFNTSNNTGWNHLLIAANLVGSPVGQVYVNDAPLAHVDVVGPLTGDIDWTVSDVGVGAETSGANKYNGDFSEFYLTDEYLDISVESNRRKFIDADGWPVDLGSDGSTPTGTAALVLFSGDTDTWHTNDGSGDGFTENGALTDAATSPSD